MQHYCEIPTPKGTMRGFFHKPEVEKCPVCIIFHGFTGQKTGTKFSYVQLSRMLESQQVATLRLDFLGSGESDLQFKDMTFKDELSCARIILEEVWKMAMTTDVYVLGHSMGGAVASELAKRYPKKIQKMCLWAPAFNLPKALDYLVGKIVPNEKGLYDHSGFEISQEFVDDIVKRDFYKGLDTYQNELLVIHGKEDTTVPYDISYTYIPAFSKQLQFITIEKGTHNFDRIVDIKEVMKATLQFFNK